jgi:hypothetical protein
MKKILLAVLLTSCGVGRHEGATAHANDPGRCFSCEGTCNLVKPALMREFGFSDFELDCDQRSLKGIESCRQCASVFEAQWGVTLTGCR